MLTSRKKIQWTQHSQIKMKQYGLSKIKLIRLVYKPERKEKGIVPGTTAVMRTNKVFFQDKKLSLKKAWQQRKKDPGEIWLMYLDSKDARKIISAWRYPGVSKPGEEIPIPDDIREEIAKGLI